ncbi:hypothetical protein GPECTOR_40g545 [Gonium pectorale]|uniref:Ricin B lectin domain-containing protein n=1 Tax=Gonium pectorale TaxID=33097 RepID=A0A150GAE6_GONPE|nr:hypothetical protein GPECTOR_40g545 [Gonium pectorale]|eukprot:KXZ46811.1 hypothetical protein GPECTOR_40g545 [Gonium pectorale]
MYALKDTEVKGGVMYVKGSDGQSSEVVRTGSAEFVVQNGTFVQRINGTGDAQLGLVVQGVARVPQPGSVYGNVLHIVTAAGTITLDGTVITFSNGIADIFTAAGFRVSNSRRVLLGAYNVLGFFNTIKNLSATGKPPAEPEPWLPSENFLMKLQIYEPCVTPNEPEKDRCVYSPPAAGGSPDARRALGASAESKTRRRRHLHVVTASHAPSHNSRVLPEAELVDIAGVTLYNGVRYMAHNETTVAYNGAIRIVYEFAMYPRWKKIDVKSSTDNLVHTWQETINTTDPVSTRENPVIASFFCRNFTLTETAAVGFNASSVLNYTYQGVATLQDDVVARHFQLNALQATSNGSTEVLTVDYYDTLNTYIPLRFEFSSNEFGSVVIDVTEFRNLTESDPEVAAPMFAAPPYDTCPNNPAYPKLSTAFATRGKVVAADPPAGPEPTGRRRARALDAGRERQLADVWNSLDHVNGTGDWPQWALDMYGGVHPGQRAGAAVRRILGDCGTKFSFGVDVGPCNIGWWTYSNGAYGLSAGCSGNSDSTFKGCVTIGIGMPKTNWLVRKIGISFNIDIASVCVGYNWDDHFYFLEATLALNIIIFKVEISAEIDFSSCCVWIASVTLEASIGVTFFNIWITVGEIDIVSDVYLKGSAEEQEETENPTATNIVGEWKTVGWGNWGDWQQQSYPCGKFFYNENSKKMEVVAMPMNSYMLRFEGSQGSGDDTALNGISGTWTASASCPTGGYFVGAKMRIEKSQGSGDDTSANSIVFTCSNQRGTDTNAYSGLWGDWTGWTYCPDNSYICGIQVRIEGQQGGGSDDTALNGLRIGCCSFPSSNETAVASQAMIYTGTNSGKSCLQVDNNQQVVGAAIKQYTCANITGQYFTVSSTPTGAYSISAIPSGLCLGAEGGGSADGTKIVLATCTNAASQLFALTPLTDGTYTISPTHASSKCLDVNQNLATDGQAIQLFWCNKDPNQAFALSLPIRQTVGTIRTRTAWPYKCVDIAGGVQASGTYVQQWSCNGWGQAQDWIIVTAGTNVYYIKSERELCMTVKGAGTGAGTRITIETCVAGAKHQMWRASAGYQGGVALSPLHATNMCLDINNVSPNDGAVIQIYGCNGTGAQTFSATLPVI